MSRTSRFWSVCRGVLVSAALIALGASAYAGAMDPARSESGKVKMVDLGARSCIPCKMMVPVMEALEKQYEGRAEIVFIDVRENPDAAARYGIRAIPTQIFYDRTGKEVLRHEGFFDRQPITEILDKLLAEK